MVLSIDCATWKFHCVHFSRRSHSQPPLHGCCSWDNINARWKMLAVKIPRNCFRGAQRFTVFWCTKHNNPKRLSIIIIYHYRITNGSVAFAQSFLPLLREKIQLELKNCAWIVVRPMMVGPVHVTWQQSHTHCSSSSSVVAHSTEIIVDLIDLFCKTSICMPLHGIKIILSLSLCSIKNEFTIWHIFFTLL